MSQQNFKLPDEPIVSKAFLKAGRSDVIKWAVIPIMNSGHLKIIFESWDKEDRHGVWLRVDGELVINGVSSQSMEIWADAGQTEILVDVRKSTGKLHIYNLWDSGAGKQSQAYTSGMLIETLPNGQRYRCNDIGLDPKFDHLIFRVEAVW